MDKILNSQGAVIVFDLIRTIQDKKDYLSEIDGAIGDGDHGINMKKGFTICKERLDGKNPDLTEALNTLGKILLMEIGGSMGPLYGTFFIEMSKVVKGREQLDRDTFLEMLDAALRGIQTYSSAKVGDKTLMDTLVPAIEAYREAGVNNRSFAEALEAMKLAAEKGMESTRDMVAKIGRASRLGERSRGVLDAGATSCCLILSSMADSVLALLKTA